MLKEIELEYTAYMLSKLARARWGDNATEYLAGLISIVSSHDQMKVLIDSLKEIEGEDK
jgi:hypothetical protein